MVLEPVILLAQDLCLMSLSKFPYRWPLKATRKVVTLEVDSTLTQKQIQKRKLKQFSFLNIEKQGLWPNYHRHLKEKMMMLYGGRVWNDSSSETSNDSQSLVVKMHVKKPATGFPWFLCQERPSISFCPDHACSLWPPGLYPARRLPRQEHWSGLPCPPPGDLPDSESKPMSPASPASGFFTPEPPGKPFLTTGQCIWRLHEISMSCLCIPNFRTTWQLAWKSPVQSFPVTNTICIDSPFNSTWQGRTMGKIQYRRNTHRGSRGEK